MVIIPKENRLFDPNYIEQHIWVPHGPHVGLMGKLILKMSL